MENDQKGKIESVLQELGKKLDHLLFKAKDASEDVREEVNEKFAELNKAKDKLEKELKDLANDEEKWKEVQGRLQNAADELKKAIEITFTKKKTHQ